MPVDALRGRRQPIRETAPSGQQVTFDLRVVSVRQASAEEIAERQAAATAEEEEES